MVGTGFSCTNLLTFTIHCVTSIIIDQVQWIDIGANPLVEDIQVGVIAAIPTGAGYPAYRWYIPGCFLYPPSGPA